MTGREVTSRLMRSLRGPWPDTDWRRDCNIHDVNSVLSLVRRTCPMTPGIPGTDPTNDELVLEPPRPVSTVTQQQAASSIRIDEATASRIEDAVNAYVESLSSLEA